LEVLEVLEEDSEDLDKDLDKDLINLARAKSV